MRLAVYRWVVVGVVVIGLIAQAAALVWHGAGIIDKARAASPASVTADMAVAALEADLQRAFCHAGSASGGTLPEPGSECPVCSGPACAYGLVAPSGLVLPAALGSIEKEFPPVDQRVARHRFLRPSSRGPPAVV